MHRRVVFVDSSVIIAALLSSRGASFHILNDKVTIVAKKKRLVILTPGELLQFLK